MPLSCQYRDRAVRRKRGSRRERDRLVSPRRARPPRAANLFRTTRALEIGDCCVTVHQSAARSIGAMRCDLIFKEVHPDTHNLTYRLVRRVGDEFNINFNISLNPLAFTKQKFRFTFSEKRLASENAISFLVLILLFICTILSLPLFPSS